jgi:hypothetical protein
VSNKCHEYSHSHPCENQHSPLDRLAPQKKKRRRNKELKRNMQQREKGAENTSDKSGRARS